jgi:hypothetical protein
VSERERVRERERAHTQGMAVEGDMESHYLFFKTHSEWDGLRLLACKRCQVLVNACKCL